MRIWFNHWFSTAYHLISLMQQEFDQSLTIIGSNSKSDAVYRRVCHEWYSEQELPEDAYTAFCLEFCREHQIDVFVPRRGMVGIAGALDQFHQSGVKVLIDSDPSIISLLDDKIATYRYFSSILPDLLPDYRLCASLEDFRSACASVISPSGRLCYKLAVDEGARSFRVIDNSIESLSALYAKPGTKVTLRAAEAILSSYDFHIPLIVMPYLSGADVSVDCLQTSSGPIIIPRFKVGRYSEVRPDAFLMERCSYIMNLLHLSRPSNIQFKMQGDIPYLLEINTRMSGGLQLSCLATDINIPGLALRELLGQPRGWSYPKPWLSASIVNLETPVITGRRAL